ncbi:MAG: hypothetical protein MJ241_04085 [Bacilli bacterium]|nr:hypothetical protein [Bacilli bacterium]
MKKYTISAILENGDSRYVKVNKNNIGECTREPIFFASLEECQKAAKHIKGFVNNDSGSHIRDIAFDVCYC